MLESLRRHIMMQQGGGFLPVEYISIPIGGYIDTGLRAFGNIKIELKFAINILQTATIFGGRTNANLNNLGLFNHTSYNFLRNAYGIFGTRQNAPCINDYSPHILVMDRGVSQFDGVNRWNDVPTQYFQADWNIIINAFNNNGHPEVQGSHKFWYFKIWDYNQGGILVRDFIAARYDNEYGLYDRVNGVFYGNAGSGIITGE